MNKFNMGEKSAKETNKSTQPATITIRDVDFCGIKSFINKKLY